MGTIAARKAAEVLFNCKKVLGIELLAAAQAVDLNPDGGKLGAGTDVAYKIIRKIVEKLDGDREMYIDFEKIGILVDANIIVDAVEKIHQS